MCFLKKRRSLFLQIFLCAYFDIYRFECIISCFAATAKGLLYQEFCKKFFLLLGTKLIFNIASSINNKKLWHRSFENSASTYVFSSIIQLQYFCMKFGFNFRVLFLASKFFAAFLFGIFWTLYVINSALALNFRTK